jgi:hypothetical protein
MRMLVRIAVLMAAVLASSAGHGAAEPPTPLFASDDMIRLTIRGPIGAVSRSGTRSSGPRPASLTLAAAVPETHAIMLSPRGITRRKPETCQFTPLRVEFTQKPAATSLFRGQRRLKLVTHCRSAASFQQILLLEYSAYRMFNLLTPLSFRVRLAQVDYVEEDGKPLISRLGFFIEDTDDAAKRNGMREAKVGDRIGVGQVSARDAARVAVFEYLIGNLDWSVIAGPAGEGCCHNSKLIGGAPTAASGLVPLPYDFDFSGLVDAPYATPPDGLGVASVRNRRYRGFCVHNAQAEAATAEVSARRAELLAVFSQVPQLDERTRRKATAYLDGFFNRTGDRNFAASMLRTCTG